MSFSKRCKLIMVLLVALFVPCVALPSDKETWDPAEHAPADLDELETQSWKGGGNAQVPESAPKLQTATVRVTTKQSSNDESFQGIPNFVRGGHNMTRVSHMLYRMIQQYKINSMVDVPCRAHSRWMGQFLENVRSKDKKVFTYYCIDSNKKILDLAASRIPGITGVSVNYLRRKFWMERIPTADLVFCWEGLEKMKVANVERFLRRLKDGGRHKYLLVGSSPGAKSNSGDLVLNVRRAPYSYGMPMRIYKQLAMEQDPLGGIVIEKQMYLYRIADMNQVKNAAKNEEEY